MSEPKLNLPMLHPFLLGEEISSHNGVTCYPAIRRGTDEKYIVKVIPIPTSKSKLDALLLTGAMESKDAALKYFMSLAKDVVSQTDILRDLSQQEGFVPYLSSEIAPMDADAGYYVYLLGTYKQSLERILRTDVMTHSDVANLGLDLCAALAACRRAGYVYVDLKPENIFRDPDHGFRIGDVGFIALQSLKYASLPEQYRSSYTAPEVNDVMAVLNPTVDIYALGLVLYQAYNGGILPFMDATSEEVLPPPIYADYEMAEIILKACHPDPAQRWQEPTKMAHALIDYLQTYGAPETPIIPPVVEIPEPEEPEEEPFLPEADPEQLLQEIADLENAAPDELAFLSGLVSDETAPNEENTADVPDDVMTQELSEMFAQADELIDHELPEPPVAPAPIFAPMPAPIILDEETENADDAAPLQAEEPAAEEDAPIEQEVVVAETAEDVSAEPAAEETPVSTDADSNESQSLQQHAKTLMRRILVAAAVIAVLVAGWFFGRMYYNDHYLVRVDELVLQNHLDKLTVQVVSDVEESLLTVICTDSYGNSVTGSVTDGIATFSDLNPNTRYTVKVEISGYHKLVGALSDSFTTPAQTQIHNFIADIGPEDRSVELNFTVTGPQTDKWTVRYSADGIAEKSLDFTGNNVIISDLVAGKLYTFTLTSPDGLYMAGQTQTQYLATNILFAQDLTITACGGGSLTVQWQQPADGNVAEWRVRCFNESGYNVTITTSELSYTFTDLDHATACTVEVTAVGMNQYVSTTISAEPVSIVSFDCAISQTGTLLVSWGFTGTAPANGWQLCYSVDGTQYVLPLSEPMANLIAVPGGNYQFTICTTDGNFVFNASHSYQAHEVTHFAGYGITTADLTILPVLLPDGDNWKPKDISTDMYRNTFAYGDKAAIWMTSALRPVSSDDFVNVDIVIYDANGQFVSVINAQESWDDLWYKSVCVLPIAELPQAAGTYTMQVFINSALVCRQDITITEPVADDPAQGE